MNTGLSRLVAVALVLSAAACSSTQKTSMVPTASNPAAVGVVKTRQTPNDNTEVKLEVQHMAPPNKVAEDAKIYVVWAKPLTEGAAPQNVGSMIVGKDRSASLETKTPHQRFDLMVTPEPNGFVSQPSHDPVLKAKIVP